MVRAADEAYATLRTHLLDGTLAPGDRLGETELAEQLGISRTPVREALRRLAGDGLVQISPNRGARVMEWSLDDVREIYELRALLEGHGAARAAVRMEEADIAKLDALCDEMERLARRRQQRDYERITELNAELHRCILESSASTRLVTVLGAVVQVPLVVHTFRRYTPQSLARSMSHHRDLVAAIRAHDSEWAASTMRSHIFAALATLNDEYRRAVN